jgi:hypothetical protein
MSPPAQDGKLEGFEPLSELVVVVALVVSRSGYQVAMGLAYGLAKTSRSDVFVQETGDVRVAPPAEL